mgnify:CR=1 FL=1
MTSYGIRRVVLNLPAGASRVGRQGNDAGDEILDEIRRRRETRGTVWFEADDHGNLLDRDGNAVDGEGGLVPRKGPRRVR